LPRLAGAALLTAAWSVAAPPVGAAQQVSASVDAGIARVEYDGFLPSGAASVSPAVRVVSDNVSFTARGTWLGFESGNSSVQALVAGSAFTAPFGGGRWRAEFSGTAGTSVYAGFVGFAHLLGRGRLHYVGFERGLWLAATTGRTYLNDEARPVRALALGVWSGSRVRNVALSAGTTKVGDTSYTDVEGSGYWRAGRFELEGSIGARGGRGGGRGVYGEASTVFSLTRRTGLTLAAGRYPTDPTRGSVSGRYASIGVRLSTVSPQPLPRTDPAWPRPPVLPAATTGTNGHMPAAALAVESSSGGARLVVVAPTAGLVEIMGDFTDWQPVALTLVNGKWRFDGRIPSGLRRLNVRIDGGPWAVPLGATIVRDDFDDVVGAIVVP